jgi:hypothetical protein
MRYGNKTQTLKVPIATLLANAQAARERMVAEHAKAVESYPERRATWEAAVISALESALAQAQAGKFPKRDWHGKLEVTPRNKVPAEPERPTLDTKAIDRDISLLKQTSQETTTVSTDSNWAVYI